MTLTSIILQILLTIPLTIILNHYSTKENKRLNQLIIPTIYIIVVSALVPIVKENIFLIVIFEIFVRNFYITSVVNRPSETRPSEFITDSIVSITLSLFVYNYFIGTVDSVIPNPEDIKPFIWFLIIIYIVYLYNISTKNKVKEDKKKNIKLKSEKIIMQYAKFKNKYSNIVKSKNKNINNLIYSLIIYKDYKTPKLYRSINTYVGAITKQETKQGIMQVPSYTRISDEQSIEIILRNFETQLKNTKLKDKEEIDKLLENCNKEEQEEIKNIYNEISEFSKK